MHEILLKFAVQAQADLQLTVNPPDAWFRGPTRIPVRRLNLRSLTQSDHMHALTEMETTDVEDEEPPTPPKPKPFTPNPAGWPANGDEVA